MGEPQAGEAIPEGGAVPGLLGRTLLLSAGELRGAFYQNLLWAEIVALGLGLVADFLQVLAPAATWVFYGAMVGLVWTVIRVARAPALEARRRYFPPLVFCVLLAVTTGAVCIAQRMVSDGQQDGAIAATVPAVKDLQEILLRLETKVDEIQEEQKRQAKQSQEQYEDLVARIEEVAWLQNQQLDTAAAQEEIERLTQELDVTRGELLGLLKVVLDRPDLPPEAIPDALAQAGGALAEAREEIESLRAFAPDVPEIEAALASAEAALDKEQSIDLEAAQASLSDARKAFQADSRERRTREAEIEWRLLMREGDLARARLRYEEAAELYAQAHDAALSEQTDLKAQASFRRGRALSNHGKLFPGLGHLADAVSAFDAALVAYSREADPATWGRIQVDRAIALTAIGKRISGAKAKTALNEAIATLDDVLTVFTRDSDPTRWANGQMNRAVAQVALGKLTDGDAGRVVLSAAVDSYDQAMTVFSREASPFDWALTHLMTRR